MEIRSSAFGHGQPIPGRYTGEGEDVSPPLSWSSVPEGAESLALIADDPDAPRDEPWVHWVLYGLPPTVDGLSEGVPTDAEVESLGPAMQGVNTGGRVGYSGPMPPPGHGTHHYRFRLYALDEALDLPPRMSKAALLEAIEGHVQAEAELVGTYER